MRGGVSPWSTSRTETTWSSPHAWGCFHQPAPPPAADRVFPTCVGVFPSGSLTASSRISLPHMRGGVSVIASPTRVNSASSPHAWGCFHGLTSVRRSYRVFPTCVGVFLRVACCSMVERSLPHMRGGVSGDAGADSSWGQSSPHAWGCFPTQRPFWSSPRVFPTCVGVFPWSEAGSPR
mgnify:FL=1